MSNRNKWEAPIYLSAVLEYLTAEVLELAGEFATRGKKARITPRHVMLAIRSDDEVSHGTFIYCCVILLTRLTR